MPRQGMVDALHEARRVLRPRGLLIDARPDSRVPASAEHQTPSGTYRTAGTIATARETRADDRASDDAVATVLKKGWFRSLGRGRFWQRVPFEDRPRLQRYLDDHLRFVHRVRWMVEPSARRRWDSDPFAIRRAVRYELLERT